ncbi:MAG: hypothetical protein AN483_01190 [Aphanizomenon flos-aquae MDT14a]|jgi:drug/metabolite transporter (DMT)-like permease|uniref:EamA domain-containing protein n=1 Tax=Aphanizomenon flos-aquae LD13 TaxID=1710894 RepID=A0A1B7VZM8_APHFL|nr:DMT family transporter [Aphanizomenon flos-aquae UKL13-PB]OBQ26473.1 MAG: hypothetical protein AN481_05145 [Aphanizomenon flos-aquae LD13]OBQ31199.1 MAG: hypothetical protein AN483_01190 [Aphanizomenon flos-aquae MDT14a]QSV68148.1 MAG: DMT family transporter [Aphanizomenon flos-aquae DEX188]HCQ21531.1 hypothetical protein [Anabaena sp. UBA12330]
MTVFNETKATFWYGVGLAVAANLLWGLAFLIPRILSSFTPVEITLGRYFFYGLISFILFLLLERKHSWIYNFKIWSTSFIFAFAANIGYYFFLVYGVRYADAEITSLIIGILPITVSIYGNFLEREYPFSKLLPSILMITSGIFIIHNLNFAGHENPEQIFGQQYYLGLLSPFVSLIVWTWYCVVNSSFLKNNPHILSSTWSTLIGVNTLIQSLIILVILMVTGNDTVINFAKYLKFDSFNFDGFDHEVIIFLISSIILGVAVSWGGTLMWNKASTLLPISLAGQLIVIETISALSYVYIYDSRLPSFFEILGITMIIGGVILGIRNVQFTSNDPELIIKPSKAQIE